MATISKYVFDITCDSNHECVKVNVIYRNSLAIDPRLSRVVGEALISLYLSHPTLR